MKKNDFVSWAGVSNWVPILLMLVSVAIAFTALKFEVSALAADNDDLRTREQMNKGQFFELVETVREIKDTVIEINTNQKHIMRELGISQ